MSNFAPSMHASCRPLCIAARPGPPETPPLERLYNTCSKTLLNVRNMTSNELYYAELGLPPALVLQRQRQFVQSLWRQRALIDDELSTAIYLETPKMTYFYYLRAQK